MGQAVSAGLAETPETSDQGSALNVPLDALGFAVSVEVSPEQHSGLNNPYPRLSSSGSSQANSMLQMQVAQQLLMFASQQASLLQQALPYMLNLPPARVAEKLRELLSKVSARPALEKLMRVTGQSEPVAQRVCLEYVNRHGKSKLEPNKVLQFFHANKDSLDFTRPLTVQDLLKHMDVEECIRQIHQRMPSVPQQTAELAATLCMADTNAAVQLLTSAAAMPAGQNRQILLHEKPGASCILGDGSRGKGSLSLTFETNSVNSAGASLNVTSAYEALERWHGGIMPLFQHKGTDELCTANGVALTAPPAGNGAQEAIQNVVKTASPTPSQAACSSSSNGQRPVAAATGGGHVNPLDHAGHTCGGCPLSAGSDQSAFQPCHRSCNSATPPTLLQPAASCATASATASVPHTTHGSVSASPLSVPPHAAPCNGHSSSAAVVASAAAAAASSSAPAAAACGSADAHAMPSAGLPWTLQDHSGCEQQALSFSISSELKVFADRLMALQSSSPGSSPPLENGMSLHEAGALLSSVRPPFSHGLAIGSTCSSPSCPVGCSSSNSCTFSLHGPAAMLSPQHANTSPISALAALPGATTIPGTSRGDDDVSKAASMGLTQGSSHNSTSGVGLSGGLSAPPDVTGVGLGGGGQGEVGLPVMLPPAQVDMLSSLVLQSNAAINRYLVERQALHKEIASLKQHKEWADSRIGDLIRKACTVDKPKAEELRSYREKVTRLHAELETASSRHKDLEESFQRLKDSTYRETGLRREAVQKLQSLSADLGASQLREQELVRQADSLQAQIKTMAKRCATMEVAKKRAVAANVEVAAALNERTKEHDKLTAALKAAESLAKDRSEAMEAEVAGRHKEQQANAQRLKALEASHAALAAELSAKAVQLQEAGVQTSRLNADVAQLQLLLQAAEERAQAAEARALRAEEQAGAADENAAAAMASATAAALALSDSDTTPSQYTEGSRPGSSSTMTTGGYTSHASSLLAAGGHGNGAGVGSGASLSPGNFMLGHWNAPDFLGLSIAPTGCPSPGEVGDLSDGDGCGSSSHPTDVVKAGHVPQYLDHTGRTCNDVQASATGWAVENGSSSGGLSAMSTAPELVLRIQSPQLQPSQQPQHLESFQLEAWLPSGLISGSSPGPSSSGGLVSSGHSNGLFTLPQFELSPLQEAAALQGRLDAMQHAAQAAAAQQAQAQAQQQADAFAAFGTPHGLFSGVLLGLSQHAAGTTYSAASSGPAALAAGRLYDAGPSLQQPLQQHPHLQGVLQQQQTHPNMLGHLHEQQEQLMHLKVAAGAGRQRHDDVDCQQRVQQQASLAQQLHRPPQYVLPAQL